LKVSWQPPASTNGGGQVVGYEVRSDGGPSADVQTTEVTFPGLENGTSYTFRIRAVTRTDAGRLVGSAATVQAVPGGPPVLSSLDARQAGDRSVTVSFGVDNNRSGPVTCRVLLNGAERWSGGCAGLFSINIGDLAYSTSYDVTAVAFNGYGTSPVLGPFPVTTNAKPRVAAVSPGDAVSSPTCTSSACRWVRVQLSGYGANEVVSVRCYSSTDPGGWFTYTLRANGNGDADSGTSSGCYYGFAGQDVWVVAGGTESNHYRW
jgi:titin